MAAPRKTVAEIRAEERMRGFSDCMEILVREWRSQVRLTPNGPAGGEALWPILEKMQAHQGLLDEDYKELMIPRLYSSKYDRLRVRVELKKPHPHAGRRGFIIDGAAFMKDGMHRVFFLDSPHHSKADNAFAKPEDIKRLK